jgi:hypothetical protein
MALSLLPAEWPPFLHQRSQEFEIGQSLGDEFEFDNAAAIAHPLASGCGRPAGKWSGGRR